jgi:hypothetical protein
MKPPHQFKHEVVKRFVDNTERNITLAASAVADIQQVPPEGRQAPRLASHAGEIIFIPAFFLCVCHVWKINTNMEYNMKRAGVPG